MRLVVHDARPQFVALGIFSNSRAHFDCGLATRLHGDFGVRFEIQEPGRVDVVATA